MRYCFDTSSTRSATVMRGNLTEEGRRTPEGVRRGAQRARRRRPDTAAARGEGARGRLPAVALPDRAVGVDDAVYLDALRVLPARRLLVRLRHVNDARRGLGGEADEALALADAEADLALERVVPDLALRGLVEEDVRPDERAYLLLPRVAEFDLVEVVVPPLARQDVARLRRHRLRRHRELIAPLLGEDGVHPLRLPPLAFELPRLVGGAQRVFVERGVVEAPLPARLDHRDAVRRGRGRLRGRRPGEQE